MIPNYKNYGKFDNDDIISETTLRLLTTLNSNILSSGITVCILDYLEILDVVLLENHQKYNRFYEDVLTMLQNNNWVKDRGFMKEPKRESLVADLNKIVTNYII